MQKKVYKRKKRKFQKTKQTHFFLLFSLINDFDLHILQFKDYGKDFPKEHNMSPDAFIQMCLQFTYFKFVFKSNH